MTTDEDLRRIRLHAADILAHRDDDLRALLDGNGGWPQRKAELVSWLAQAERLRDERDQARRWAVALEQELAEAKALALVPQRAAQLDGRVLTRILGDAAGWEDDCG